MERAQRSLIQNVLENIAFSSLNVSIANIIEFERPRPRYDLMAGIRLSYLAAYAAVSNAVPALDTSVITETIQQFPVLRTHACTLLCDGSVELYTCAENTDMLTKLCRIIGFIVAPQGQLSHEGKYCAKRIWTCLDNAGGAVLSRVVLNAVRLLNADKVCGPFVLYFLDEALASLRWDDKLIKEVCCSLRSSIGSSAELAGDSLSERFKQLLMNFEKRSLRKEEPDETGMCHVHAQKVFVSLERPRLFAHACKGHEMKYADLGRLGLKRGLQRGPFSSNDVCSLLEVVAVHEARPTYMLKLIQKHNVAYFLIDITVYFLAEHFSSIRGEARTFHHADVHSSSLLRHMLSIVEHDSAINVYTYSLNNRSLEKDGRSGVHIHAEKFSTYEQFLLEHCISISAQKRLNVLDTSVLTKHLVCLYLSRTCDAKDEAFKLRGWMAISDIGECLFTALRTKDHSLQTILAFWNCLSNDNQNESRVTEIDYMFVSRLNLENELHKWLVAEILLRKPGEMNMSNIFCRGNATVHEIFSPILLNLIKTMTDVAVRSRHHCAGFWESFIEVISVLEARFVWELIQTKPDHNSRQAFSNGFDLIVALIDSPPKGYSCKRGPRSNFKLRVCRCGGLSVTGTKDCVCTKPRWKSLKQPNSDWWFLWTSLKPKVDQVDLCTDTELRKDSFTAAIFLSDVKVLQEKQKFALFRSICGAVFNAVAFELHIDFELRTVCNTTLPGEIKFVLLKLLGQVGSNSRRRILEEMDSCARRAWVRDKGVRANNVLSTSLERCKLIRLVFNTVWQCSVNEQICIAGAEIVESEVVLIEQILQFFYPSISEFISHMNDMPSVMQFAGLAAMETPPARKGDISFIYLSILRGYESHFCEHGESNFSPERSLAQNILSCFDI